MKGILLAGGSGTRLYPLTKTTSKQLLPVYDKPMIYYPLSTLMLFGIKEVLIISTPKDTPNIEELFGDGSRLGMKIHYAIQNEPKGIAQAFTIGADFIGNDDVCLILGDNIFYMGDQIHSFKKQIEANKGGIVFGYYVNDPKRFGIIEVQDEQNHKILSLEEKPEHPKSNIAAVGLYFYKNNVIEKARNLKPSKRGELEITDLNKEYLQENRLEACLLKRGTVWLDAGTPDSLMDAATYVQLIEKRQGLKISCIEEIAYRRKFISDEQFLSIINELPDGINYKEYLKRVYREFNKNV